MKEILKQFWKSESTMSYIILGLGAAIVTATYLTLVFLCYNPI